MKNLLKHEFFKLFYSKGFTVLLIVVGALSLLYGGVLIFSASVLSDLSGEGIPGGEIIGMFISGKTATLLFFMDVGNLSIIVGVIVAMIIVSDFRNDTIKNTAMYRYTRQSIFLAKMITQAVAIFIILFVNVAILIIMFMLYSGWGEAFTLSSLWENVIKIFLMGLLLSFAIAAFCNMFAFMTKSTALVITAVFLLSFISTIFLIIYAANQTPFWEFIYKILYSSVLTNYITEPETQNLVYYIASISILFFPCMTLSFLKFQKQEL